MTQTGLIQLYDGSVITEPFDVRRYGAVGDGVTDDTAAFVAARNAANAAGGDMYVPAPLVTYRLLSAFELPQRMVTNGAPRLVYDGSPIVGVGAFTISGAPYTYNRYLGPCVLDANGKADYAIAFLGAIDPVIDQVRTTNASIAGFYGAFVQSATFIRPVCSHNVEAFATIPVNGMLFADQDNSDNLILDPILEGVSGAGILISYGINNKVIGGTSEGNAIGIELDGSAHAVHYNSFDTVDVEANTTADVYVHGASAYQNAFNDMAGSSVNGLHVANSAANTQCRGGSWGGVTLDAGTARTLLLGIGMLGAGATLVDNGTGTVVRDSYQLSTGSKFVDKTGFDVQFNGKFSCNSATPQAALASGGAAPAGGTGTAAGGYDTAAHRDALITLVNTIRTALVANGIMS